LREKGRRVGCARRPQRQCGCVVLRRHGPKEERALCRASGKRGQQVAQRLSTFIRMAAGEVDEITELVDVLDRVLKPRLQACKQRADEKDPRETGEHRALGTYFAGTGTASVRR
jgi:hypothetical protein